jgi:hypothetical protein
MLEGGRKKEDEDRGIKTEKERQRKESPDVVIM